MKKNIRIYVLLLASLLAISSCSFLLEPSHAEDPKVLCYASDCAVRGFKEQSISSASNSFTESILNLQYLGWGGTEDPEEKIKNTQMIDWEFNADILNSSNNDAWGYFVYYKVNIDDKRGYYYVLISLTEFGVDKYEYRVEATADSFAEIKSYTYEY